MLISTLNETWSATGKIRGIVDVNHYDSSTEEKNLDKKTVALCASKRRVLSRSMQALRANEDELLACFVLKWGIC